MKLNLLERLVIQKILPKEGDFVTLKVLNSLKLTLAPSEEELKEFELKNQDGMITWNSKGSEEREISIGEKATDIIVNALKDLDKNKKLTQEHYTIYEKFVV
jgi:hypothetical protein